MPKLPADLPKNWTRGQIVSPNGTETGLTEKHGYNYLMKQVNNTQTEVNNINTALTDVAQQTTVNEINNKIGTESDADTQPTLFGRLAELKKVLTEKLTELLTKVTGVDGKIGTAADTSADDTLFGKVASMKTNLENSSGVYQYSKTAIKKRIQNWTILPPGEEPDVSFYGKLTTLHAEKDGMVYVKIDSKDKGQTHFGIFHSVGAAIHDMPDQTTISGYNTYTHRMLEAYAAYVDEYNNTGTTARNVVLELAIPVQGGVDYVFMYYGYRQDEAVLNEFILAYEDGTEEA